MIDTLLKASKNCHTNRTQVGAPFTGLKWGHFLGITENAMADLSLETLVAGCHMEEADFCVQRLGGIKRMLRIECVDLHA